MPARAKTAKSVTGKTGMATPKELAEYLHRPLQTLANWRWQGKGPKCQRVGRGILYDWADVDEWLTNLPTRGSDTHRGAA